MNRYGNKCSKNVFLNNCIHFTLPPDKILMYTRALVKSPEPLVALPPAEASFNWLIPPPSDGLDQGFVYADGSRLFAEHKYSGLLARQGWACVVINSLGAVVAAASGTTPRWAKGIYAAELWALLQATLCTTPGSIYHVDCQSVQKGANKGTLWAASAARRFSRGWIPLSAARDDAAHDVLWMPAHLGDNSAGNRTLSNGRPLHKVDIAANALADEQSFLNENPNFGERFG